MLPVIIYILGCYLAGLSAFAGGTRQLRRIILGVCALLCGIYLVVERPLLPGLSISSLSVGETRDPEGRAPRWSEAPRGPAVDVIRVLDLGKSVIAAASAVGRALGGTAAAAGFGAMLYLLGAAAMIVRPRAGLYLILFFSLAGDPVMEPWYPFVKGFSSPESIFFVHDAFIVSPLEIYILLIGIGWFARQLRAGGPGLQAGLLYAPALVFLAFVVFGLVHGIATGGDLRMALWEVRAVAYVPVLIILTTELVDTPAQATSLMWVAVAAVFVKGASASFYYLWVLEGDLSGVPNITEHGAAIQVNALLVLSFVVWIYEASWGRRVLLAFALPFVLPGYVAMQRRAAFVTLAVAALLAIAVLFRTNRRRFWIAAPALLVLGAGYVAGSWNSQGTLAVPAQAIKSVIAAELASDKDQSSNNYRVLENENITFTIHQHPFTGIGFGQKFSVVVPMPDISRFFQWWEYIPHNSMMWIWLKAGIGGFFSLLCLIGLAIAGGAYSLRYLSDDGLRTVVLTATLYFVMHFIYACVDMSWDRQSTVFVGIMMGVVNCLTRQLDASAVNAAGLAHRVAKLES